MKSARPCVLTINGGSSSIKFALFEAGEQLVQTLEGKIEGVGLAKGSFTVKGSNPAESFARPAAVPDHSIAVGLLMDWIQERMELSPLTAVGHRVVHGGPKYWEPQRITPEMIEELRQLSPFDPDHLPEEILLTVAFHRRFPNLTQIACFDTAFHHDMPRVARLLPIPRRYDARGIRRYGFHGLSYAYLMQELGRVAGTEAAKGRVILAHLGSGASLAAVLDGQSIDTTMAFTPAAGLVMGTRSGDIDPGLVSFLSRSEKMTPAQFDRMANHESGTAWSIGNQFGYAGLARTGKRRYPREGGGSSILLSGEEVDWSLRRRVGGIGHVGVCRGHRRKRTARTRADLPGIGFSGHCNRRVAQSLVCRSNFDGGQPGYRSRHSHG